MSKLQHVYKVAIEHTKQKVLEDMDQYLKLCEKEPTFEQYLIDRQHYMEQIWVNVWLNKVTNDIPRREKKLFLKSKDYEVEGVDRKIINRVFRNEVRDYHPFQVKDWLEERVRHADESWSDRYIRLRSEYLRKEEEKRLLAIKEGVIQSLKSFIMKTIEQKKPEYFLLARHFVAKSLKNDFQSKVKYKAIDTYRLEEVLVEDGVLEADDYKTVGEFFEELTGAVHFTGHWSEYPYEYETYYYLYEKQLTDYFLDKIPEDIMKGIDPTQLENFENIFKKPLTSKDIQKYSIRSIDVLIHEFMRYMLDDYIDQILTLNEYPFDLVTHKELYNNHVLERARRKELELEEERRKKEEEARMLHDIFGREYQPSVNYGMKYVLHIGETNTGKTFQALKRMEEAETGLYLAPLRLLALEVFDTLNGRGIPCMLKTGEEEKIVEGALHASCTVEMFREKDYYDVIVIDEAQMLADKDRGYSWYKAITKARAKEIHIIGSRNIKPMLLQLLDGAEVEIFDYKREIPLQVEKKEFKLTHTKKADAIVCFSRRRVLETASILQNNGHSVSMIYGSMPPETRKKQIQRFLNGETNVIVATDAIGMGLNLPIRRVIFLENEKFDGVRRRRLKSHEVKQVAGRAGRKGIYNIGKVAFTQDVQDMAKLLEQEDEHVQTFAIAPTASILERFQKYSRKLDMFFELWEKFESPPGTTKASLQEERFLYETIKDTVIEARIPLQQLYHFLHLPFSTKEQMLVQQWYETMNSIAEGTDLPEPEVNNESLESIELSYKAIGLHLLFLYRLDRRTEALYWERIRETYSDQAHERLNTDVQLMKKKCKKCRKPLDSSFKFDVCDACHYSRLWKRHRRY